MTRSRTARLPALAALALTFLAPARAEALTPSMVAGMGPAIAAGEGSENLKSGQSFLLNALARGQRRNNWVLQASYERYDREGADDGREADHDGVKVVVDPSSAQLLQGATLDYNDGLQGAGFAIDNPNATRSCGCGKSFS